MSSFSRPWNRTALLIVALAASGCVAMEDRDDPQLSSTTKPAYVLSTAVWDALDIPVCWENASAAPAHERAWVRDAIQDTWEAYSQVRFVGWEQCGILWGGLRIEIEDSNPRTIGLGTDLEGASPGMYLNFTFENFSQQACQPASARQGCIENIAIHEFGHALGFAHEQNRDDTPAYCQPFAQGADGDTPIGPWDDDSVMNYCNFTVGDLALSDTDQLALQMYYGAPAPAAFMASGTMLGGYRIATLTWDPPFVDTGVDVFRDGVPVGTTDNDGNYNDWFVSSASSANYWVCVAGTTYAYNSRYCSAVKTATF